MHRQVCFFVLLFVLVFLGTEPSCSPNNIQHHIRVSAVFFLVLVVVVVVVVVIPAVADVTSAAVYLHVKPVLSHPTLRGVKQKFLISWPEHNLARHSLRVPYLFFDNMVDILF